MKVKYFYQQFISHISIIIVAFLVLSLIFAHYIDDLVYQYKAEELRSYGENILGELEQGREDPKQVLRRYSQVLSGRNIQFSLFNANSEIIMQSGRGTPNPEISEKVWQQITKGEPVVVKSDLEMFGQGVTFVLLPSMQNGELLYGILLASPISGSREMISQINQYLFYTVLVALAVSLLLSWILSKIHVNRIKRIQEATSMVSAGDYSVNIPASNFDEIGELAGDFNHMVAKLKASREEIESLENRRRQFIADVSHELRTPLTTISGVIEGLRSDMIPEGEKEKGIQLVSQETKRLIRLVNENLDYEKIRSNQVKLNKEEIQLIEVLEIIQEQLENQAAEKNNRIIVEAPNNLHVFADYDRLLQILINITKNGIQFTEDGTISLRGIEDDRETVIEIEDTGAGIDLAEIENIWRRFYKAEVSRTTNPYGEFGLGLSIVKQLVQLHDGKIEVSSEKGRGTKFVIRLPAK
ncbi:sensor histidine kinase [Bacillus sp. T33-2]|uniref:sensor histidine kinase n=1 Tax=Bacillus sp. T33-2 TaxID=2054168 RepID=UPI000C79219C|nr:HAMP domain-containing sensor histidine kinase [Bacillus sp. T33-2]PLR96806.1 sensor histidine kinase [Bacillus sp. T33-2]